MAAFFCWETGGANEEMEKISCFWAEKNSQAEAMRVGFTLLDSASNFTGTQASCADVDGTNSAVVYDLHFLHVWFPGFIGASGDLATVNADSVAGLLIFCTNFALCHWGCTSFVSFP